VHRKHVAKPQRHPRKKYRKSLFGWALLGNAQGPVRDSLSGNLCIVRLLASASFCSLVSLKVLLAAQVRPIELHVS
jgi:hypothetical protein